MKIHGTAKGGAESKKDFGVAFGGAASSWDYTSDFSTADGWTSTASEISVDTTNEEIDFAFTRDGANQALGRDFDVIDNATWIFRAYEWNFSSLIGLDSSVETFFGFSDKDQDSSSVVSQDSLVNFHRYLGGSNSELRQYGASESDGSAMRRGSDELLSWTPSTDTDYYLQCRRMSSTTFNTDVFDDSAFTSSVNAQSDAVIPSTIISLQYLKYMNDKRGAQAGSTITGTLQQIKFADGVSVAPS